MAIDRHMHVQPAPSTGVPRERRRPAGRMRDALDVTSEGTTLEQLKNIDAKT